MLLDKVFTMAILPVCMFFSQSTAYSQTSFINNHPGTCISSTGNIYLFEQDSLEQKNVEHAIDFK